MLETIVREPEDGFALPSSQHTTGPLRLSRIALSAQRIQSNLVASEPAHTVASAEGRALHNSTVADVDHTNGPSAFDSPVSQMAEDNAYPMDTTAIDLLKLLKIMRRPGYAQRYRRALDEAGSVRQPPQSVYPGTVQFGLATDAHGLPYGGDIPEGYYWAVYQPETESAGVDQAGGLGLSPLASPVTTLEPPPPVDSSTHLTQSVASCSDPLVSGQQEDAVAGSSTELHDRMQDVQINPSTEAQGRIILRAPGFTLRGPRTPDNAASTSMGPPSGTRLSTHVTPGNSRVSPATNTKATVGLAVEGAASSRGVKRARTPSTSTSSYDGHSDSDDPDTESSHTSATSSFSGNSKRVVITLNPARIASVHSAELENPFVCGLDGCQVEYASLEPLLRHRATSVLHAGRNYHCEACGNCYSRVRRLFHCSYLYATKLTGSSTVRWP